MSYVCDVPHTYYGVRKKVSAKFRVHAIKNNSSWVDKHACGTHLGRIIEDLYSDSSIRHIEVKLDTH